MERIEGWELKLDDFIKSRQNVKFEWGIHDCALFACDAIREITGTDPAYYFRGKYKTKDEAYLLLKEFARGGLEETVEKLSLEFGFDEISDKFAGRGDWVLCNVPTVINEELPTLGIVGMTEMIHIAGTRQLQIFEKTSGVRFWKV
jgi:hypothetical protein